MNKKKNAKSGIVKAYNDIQKALRYLSPYSRSTGKLSTQTKNLESIAVDIQKEIVEQMNSKLPQANGNKQPRLIFGHNTR